MHLAPQHTRTYFVTVVAAGRRRLFQVETSAELFLDVLQANRTQGRMAAHAFVVMPDHVHLLLTPAPEVSLEKAVQYLKGGFSFRLKSKLDVWERGYNERRIVDATAYDACKGYIEQNPVRARLVLHAEAYRFSSACGLGVDERPVWFSQG